MKASEENCRAIRGAWQHTLPKGKSYFRDPDSQIFPRWDMKFRGSGASGSTRGFSGHLIGVFWGPTPFVESSTLPYRAHKPLGVRWGHVQKKIREDRTPVAMGKVASQPASQPASRAPHSYRLRVILKGFLRETKET